MKSPSKTKQSITEELAFLRRRVQKLEQAGSVHEKTAEALARAAKEWQETFDATRDAIWILDQDHRLLRSNKTAEHFFNLSCREMIGKRCWEIVHGTTQPIPECPMLRAQKSLCRETMQLHVGESWFEVIVDPILDGAGQFAGAVHIVSDITARKRAEEALRESEIRYQSIFENTGTVMLIVEEDMTISFANAEFENLTGYTRQEIEGKKKWTEFVEKADLERMIHQHGLRRTDKSRAKRSYEFRLVHRDGHTKDILLLVDIIPGTKKSVASLIDITARKQAEEELHESRRRMEDIIEFLPDATLVVDREGRVIAWN
ncbi:MAG: PAS domain S-box protein, partial [Deltaproteobacteria bacterium]|nr:PAS domain S-box protein [Deltaproteobacteria bacterium]